eukprot:5800481-Amphidinium_carterae.1
MSQEAVLLQTFHEGNAKGYNWPIVRNRKLTASLCFSRSRGRPQSSSKGHQLAAKKHTVCVRHATDIL